MITTTEAQQMLTARGIPAPYGTVVRWARDGMFPGAQLDDSHPRGPLWLIPADAVAKFNPPTKGRPPKPASAKLPAKRRGRKAA